MAKTLISLSKEEQTTITRALRFRLWHLEERAEKSSDPDGFRGEIERTRALWQRLVQGDPR